MTGRLGLLAAIMFTAGLTACGGQPGPDMGAVLDRTSKALAAFQTHLEKQGVAQATNEHMSQLTGFLHRVLNHNPPVHTTPVGIKLLKDAKFEGFDDSNRDNVQDIGEKRLFTLEIDFDGKRLIATGQSGQSTGMGLASGLLTGMLLGRLLSNQRAAGIRPGHFAGRNVSPRSAYPARARARSGGLFRGK
jgi:hypothetical protein